MGKYVGNEPFSVDTFVACRGVLTSCLTAADSSCVRLCFVSVLLDMHRTLTTLSAG